MKASRAGEWNESIDGLIPSDIARKGTILNRKYITKLKLWIPFIKWLSIQRRFDYCGQIFELQLWDDLRIWEVSVVFVKLKDKWG